MDEIRQALAQTALFSGLDPATIDLLAATVRKRTLGSGEYLFRQGAPREALYLVADGQVEISREGAGASQSLIVLGPGDAAGEGALLHAANHTTSARAISRAAVYELRRDALRDALAASAPAAIEVLTRVAVTIGRRLQYASSRPIGLAKAYASGVTRREHDLLGDRDVAEDALYGIQTLRAVENFPITGIRMSHFPFLVRALAMVKQSAARANAKLGLLPADVASVVERACQEIIDGHWHGHFVVDMVQGGAGTSANMNANEVIANRALELMGRRRGDYEAVHPNNHVNLSQSTNDVYPTAIRVATVLALRPLLEALERMRDTLVAKAEEFREVLKMGRTQLQDAVPMTLGQEFNAFAVTTNEDIARLREAARLFLEINMGGTAIGTGINADPHYPQAVTEELRRISGLDVTRAENLIEATPDTGAFVLFSGVLKRVAVKLSKMCNDLRLLSSGPRAGFGEIALPAVQPGSSIMPGKVNPVIPEVVNQVAFEVAGNDLTITMAAEAGQLQLNAMEPIIAFNLFQSIDMLAAAVDTLTVRCIRGIKADAERCRRTVEQSIGVVTALVPALGYERTTEVARVALETGRSVREIVLERGYMEAAEVDRLLSPEAMTRPRPLPPPS
ncbi:MAG: aspartate ammonia-lyase [Acidobacteria bacterium]|nr:aspartate ammonia-lyase [Acidobacteriota bacterium]